MHFSTSVSFCFCLLTLQTNECTVIKCGGIFEWSVALLFLYFLVMNELWLCCLTICENALFCLLFFCWKICKILTFCCCDLFSLRFGRVNLLFTCFACVVHGLLRGKEGAAKWNPNWKHWEKSLTQGEAIVSNQLSSLNYYFCTFFNCCALLTQCVWQILTSFCFTCYKIHTIRTFRFCFFSRKGKKYQQFVLFSFAVLDKYLEVILLDFL